MSATDHLNGHQFGYANPAASAGDFAGQMHEYRNANEQHPGVQSYHSAQETGFMAHVEGLIHHARTVDSWGGRLHDSRLYDEKKQDLSTKYTPAYANNMREAIRNGTSDPIHVAMGHDMAHQSIGYGYMAEEEPNETWLGNGHHRLVMAHDSGIKRIKAQRDARGTGRDDSRYEAPEPTDMSLYMSHPSQLTSSPKTPPPPVVNPQQFSSVGNPPRGVDAGAWNDVADHLRKAGRGTNTIRRVKGIVNEDRWHTGYPPGAQSDLPSGA